MQKRVVVTGMGVLSPIGSSLTESWKNIGLGKSGLTYLEGPEYQKLPCRVAGFVKEGKERLNLSNFFGKSELKTMSTATAYALLATKEALQDANLMKMSDKLKIKTGVAVGMGIVNFEEICNTHEDLMKGYHHVNPFFIPRVLQNMAAGQISIKYGFHGPNHSVSTACATGAHAIGDALRFIRNGDADVMICGGTEACISPLAIAAFCRLRALSTSFNDTPEKASRPFDLKRDGFVMSEGSAILVMETLEHAVDRKAHIYAEVLGYGLSGDASHLTAPNGIGAFLAMERALKDAKIPVENVSYINAHATSTPLGDTTEINVIKKLFNNDVKKLSVSSTKGAHGHLLGAAGNVEAVFTIKAVEEGILPPTVNLEDSVDKDINFVPNKSQIWIHSPNGRRIALKNAFGFGGTNACLCIGQYLS